MKIALIGYGKMGRAIEKPAMAGGHEIVLRADEGAGAEQIRLTLPLADVAIEFSRPEAAFDNVRMCIEAGVPVVCGTTGWQDRMEEARKFCMEKGGAFFYASNFSVGVYLFLEINRRLAQLMNRQVQYEASIEEIHHIHKLDAPSGTAVTLAEAMLEGLERMHGWTKGFGNDPALLPIVSIRQGEAPGTHTVRYRSQVDSITLSHEAYSREGFASGALLAAGWLIGRQGVFGMGDLLG